MIKLSGVKEENFNDYKKVGMHLAFPYCDFKCLREQNLDISICLNSDLEGKNKLYAVDELINTYRNNILTDCIIMGGLEPLDSFEDIVYFISEFRKESDDDVVIYTGYNEDEIEEKIEQLAKFKNIIVKFGRFVFNDEDKYDEVLGITLASKNQYAKKIS